MLSLKPCNCIQNRTAKQKNTEPNKSSSTKTVGAGYIAMK